MEYAEEVCCDSRECCKEAAVAEAYKAGKLQEVFGSGTAAVISPVGHLKYGDLVMEINDNKIGTISQKLYDTMTGMQYGKLADDMGWIVPLKK